MLEQVKRLLIVVAVFVVQTVSGQTISRRRSTIRRPGSLWWHH